MTRVETLLPPGWTLRVIRQDPPGDPYAAIAISNAKATLAEPGIAYHGGATRRAALDGLARVLEERRPR